MLRRLCIGLVGLSAACGGAAPAARPPEPASPAKEAVKADPNLDAPSAELARYWVAPTRAQQFNARVALGKLTKSPLFGAVWPSLGENVPQQFAPCAKAILAHATDLALRGSEERGFAVLSTDAQGVAALQSDCKAVLAGGVPVTLAGASSAVEHEGEVVAFVAPSAVIYGSRAEVEAALKPDYRPAALPSTFTLEGDEMAAIHVDVASPPAALDATIAAGPERFELDATAEMAIELAERLEQGFSGIRAQAKQRMTDAGAGAFGQALLDAVTLERNGNRVHGALVLKGNVEQQAQALGQLAAMSVFGVRRYIANAKTAEAKANLALIVKDYQEALREPKKPKKLASLPPVPAGVPRGEKYQSKPEEWKAWAPIAFSLTEPQYFQYEVIAAKDGKSAVIVARGDLDGDGQTSEMKLSVALDAKSGQLTAKSIDETNPME